MDDLGTVDVSVISSKANLSENLYRMHKKVDGSWDVEIPPPLFKNVEEHAVIDEFIEIIPKHKWTNKDYIDGKHFCYINAKVWGI